MKTLFLMGTLFGGGFLGALALAPTQPAEAQVEVQMPKTCAYCRGLDACGRGSLGARSCFFYPNCIEVGYCDQF